MTKYLFRRDTILATIMVFVVMGLLSLVPVNTHILDPIKMALQDFDYNDLAYSNFHKNEHTGVDTNTIVMNIGNADRPQLVTIIEKLLAEKPAVIGVDVLFNSPKGIAADTALSALFAQNNTLVLAYDLIYNNKSMQAQGFLYPVAQQKGYANFVGEEGGVIRHFAPSVKEDNKNYQSFAVTMAQVAYPGAFKRIGLRNKTTEQVNYTRTADKFILVDGLSFLEDSTSNLYMQNKAVLLGYIPADPNSVEDKHFTAFNKKSVGRSIPDMEGVFVHANILSMIRDGDYIKKSPVWINWLIASLLCWFHMSLFIQYFLEKHVWFHLVAKLAQLVSAVLFIYMGLLFYYKWDLKVNLTPSFVAIILAVDVLYFYEAFMAWLHKNFGVYSIFINTHH